SLPDALPICLRHILEAVTVICDPGECLPDVGEAEVVAGLLEQRQRRRRLGLVLVEASVWREPQAVPGSDDVRERLARFVAYRPGPLSRRLGQRGSSLGVGDREYSGVVELEVDVESKRPRQLEALAGQGSGRR